MRYLYPFSTLTEHLVFSSEDGKPSVKMTYDNFEALVRKLLNAVEVDEEWYRRSYPDVEIAIRQGVIGSAHEHFVTSGYLEGRLPGEIEVDEEWYFRTYPDIASAAKVGEVGSAKQHFLAYGYAEGRMPAP
jgi:hypothetical protein